MNHKLFLCIGMCICSSLTTEAQIRFIPKPKETTNALGVIYSLPVTTLKIDVEGIKVVEEAGPYALYAEKYLGVKDAVMNNKVYYELGAISTSVTGLPDQTRTYMIEVGKLSIPRIQLTSDGVMMGFNHSGEAEKTAAPAKTASTAAVTGPEINITSEDLLMANSTSKMAEVVAQQIYRLRESRTDILTGDAENMPSDGEALKLMLKTLEDEEKQLVAQFVGKVTRSSSVKTLYYEPGEDVTKEILFRFSAFNGVVDKEDLSGEPIYLNLQGDRYEPRQLSEKDQKKLDKEINSGRLGMPYIVPGEASIEIYNNKTKTLSKGKFLIAQYGELNYLPLELFNPGKNEKLVQLVLYPETGAIKEIVK